MKNVFSYPYGTIFTGKEIKEFLLAWQKKGNSLYRMKQFLNCKDDRFYRMSYDTTPSGENPVKYRTFIRVDNAAATERIN